MLCQPSPNVRSAIARLLRLSSRVEKSRDPNRWQTEFTAHVEIYEYGAIAKVAALIKHPPPARETKFSGNKLRLGETTDSAPVVTRGNEKRKRFKAITTGPAYVLVESIDRFRKLRMDDCAHIGLVDAQTEGGRRDNEIDCVGVPSFD